MMSSLFLMSRIAKEAGAACTHHVPTNNWYHLGHSLTLPEIPGHISKIATSLPKYGHMAILVRNIAQIWAWPYLANDVTTITAPGFISLMTAQGPIRLCVCQFFWSVSGQHDWQWIYNEGLLFCLFFSIKDLSSIWVSLFPGGIFFFFLWNSMYPILINVGWGASI